MFEYTAEGTARINAASLDVWRAFFDFGGHAAWNPFMVRVRGRAEAGAGLEVWLRPGDGRALVGQSPALQASSRRSLVLRPVVVRHEPPRLSEWRGTALWGLCRHVFRFDVAHLDKQTTAFTATFFLSGPLAPLLAGPELRSGGANLQRMADMLRAVCEVR